MTTRSDQLCQREFLTRATQATVAVAASVEMAASLSPRFAGAAEASPPLASRISYYCNGEIHANEVGKPEGTPLTTGHWDFKPSWSKTGDMLVCFRRLKDDPVTVKWKTAVFVINVDGTGFHQLSDGIRTWISIQPGRGTAGTRRSGIGRNDGSGGFYVMQGKVGGKPGEEVAVTDESFNTWAHSCLGDGRILVNSYHPTQGWGVYLISRKERDNPLYERVEWELNCKGQMHRASISPSEKKVCFEFLPGAHFQEPGRALYIADFDAQRRTISTSK